MIVGTQLVALLGLAYFLFRQMNVVERRLTVRIQETEDRVTKRIQEVNDDTKTLIHRVGVLHGRAGLLPPGDEPEPGEATAAG